MANGIGVTRGVSDWNFQKTHIERHMDDAAYSAAHPDDTLVLAGPPRFSSVNFRSNAGGNTLLAIGMLQGFQFSQNKPTQPMMAIGSGRQFFVSGKAQTQWSVQRLFVNGRNLLRVLSHNAVAANVDVHKFDDPAGKSKNSNFFTNLDSELYYVPFGMACFFRNKVHDLVGSFYAELCMINSYSVGVTAGQNMIMESVTGLADRMLPLEQTDVAGQVATVPRATIDALLDFTSGDATPGNSQVTTDESFGAPNNAGAGN